MVATSPYNNHLYQLLLELDASPSGRKTRPI
jgi:hypothetical protein